MFGESFKFFDPPTTKWWSFKFFAKLNGNHILMTNFAKFRKYQTFCLIELHNVSKGQLANRIFKFWKSCLRLSCLSCVYDYWVVERTHFVKNFKKKLPGFKIDFESPDKVLPLHQYIWSEISRQWNNSPYFFFFF